MQWWAAGGFFMYAVLGTAAFVALGVALTFVAAGAAWYYRPLRTPSRVVGIIGVVATVAPLVVGIIGWGFNRAEVDRALIAVDPTQAKLIRAVAYGEARHPMDLGSGLTCVLLVPAALGGLMALTVPPSRARA